MPRGEKRSDDSRKKTTNQPAHIDDRVASEMYKKGAADADIANKVGVSKQAIAKWRRTHGNLPANRFRGQRGSGKKIRVDRLEAVEKVLPALINAPTARYRQLAIMAWPELASGETTGISAVRVRLSGQAAEHERKIKAAVERTRRALSDLDKSPVLAGGDAETVIAILADRALMKQHQQRVRSAQRAAVATRRAEAERRREERLRQGTARYLMQRVAYYSEAVAAMKEAAREIIANGNPDQGLLYSLPGSKDRVPGSLPVPHFNPGAVRKKMKAKEARWRAEMEVTVQQKVTNLAAVPPDAAIEILRAARNLRQTQRRMLAAWKGRLASEYKAADTTDPELKQLKERASRAAADLKAAARRAVQAVGWADPEGAGRPTT